MNGKCTDTRIGESIALYECGALDDRERRVFLDHLIECEYCYDKVYALEPVMTAFRSHRNAVRVGMVGKVAAVQNKRPLIAPARTWRFPALVVSSLLIVASGLIILIFLRGAGTNSVEELTHPPAVAQGNLSPWEDLEIPKAIYTPPREQVTLRTPIKAFDRAMAAYQASNFSDAAEQLDALSEMEPALSPEVNFYLGVSLLKVGRSHDAISPLKRVVELSGGARQEAGHYYLAFAYLKRNQPQQAIAELDSVISTNGPYGPEARKLRQKVIESLE
jgi:tetratricopeptide (TPR) repeat protein